MPSAFETTRPRILVVDDDPAVRELITTRLQLAGYVAWSARDGREGLKMVASLQPAALILDLNMPVLDGFGVLRGLDRASWTTKPKVMVLTARNRPDDVRLAIELGASDFLAKPFDDRHLLARVARLLRRHQPESNTAKPDPDAVLPDT